MQGPCGSGLKYKN
ncbi:MAG: SEC-C domain-containing protein [Bacteroidales bacterium]|nr:SEC-C domain-containing protein [Bacteroidales bacterium]